MVNNVAFLFNIIALGVQPAQLNKPAVELEWEMVPASRMLGKEDSLAERGEAAKRADRSEEVALGLVRTTKIRQMMNVKFAETTILLTMLMNIKKT